VASFLDRILRVGEGRVLKQLKRLTQQVNALEDDYRELTDEELRGETERLRERYRQGETLDELLPEAFAAVREAADRTIGMRHFDVQIMGGAALHLGNIAEMKTGEGKTLVATLPAFLNAIADEGVHIVTVNDFLAKYQSDLMGRVFRALGMTTGCLINGQTPDERRQMYAADITYGTNNEFGFDYLRDNMAWSEDELVQRGHFFVIVDEVDSILIDEARTPLIISGPADGAANRWFSVFARVAKRLTEGVDYEVDEKKRTVGVLEPGIAKVEDYLGIENLYESANTPLISFLNNAIKARALFKRDKDYVVIDGEVLIVDEHTGRIMAGRRYNEGIHQSIEAKEGVEVKAENQTLATITLQNYFRLYKKLSGMTGTAMTEAAEFQGTYKLGVVEIPTNKPMIRADQSDLVYRNQEVKFRAVVDDIAERVEKHQPVLVGTTSVEKSEYLSQLLRKRGIKHEVLNAKNHSREAAIVAQAGRLSAVTVATNMAGRGTDIMLGGNAEFLAVEEMAKRGLTPTETPDEYERQWDDVYQAMKRHVEEEAEEVAAAGGLYVLGTERHESRRIDNQLRGRSGRQGDPGESRFYLSLTDDLMRLFNAGAAEAIMARSGDTDIAIESRVVSRAIRSAQSQVESRNSEMRKNVLKYDDVLDRQRRSIYTDRRRILRGENLHEQIIGFLRDSVTAVVHSHVSSSSAELWDFGQMWTDLRTLYPVSITVDEVKNEIGDVAKMTEQWLVRQVSSDAELAYQHREDELGEDAMRKLERLVLLSVLDRHWRDHLYEMDYLKEGIGLRSMAQNDPLVEYQNEGYAMYQQMIGAVKEETVSLLFYAEVETAAGGEDQAVQVSAKGLPNANGPASSSALQYSGTEENAGTNDLDAGQQPTTAVGEQLEALVKQQARTSVDSRDGSGGGNRAQRRAAKRRHR
jgi:preprotein translocase subunit SecA